MRHKLRLSVVGDAISARPVACPMLAEMSSAPPELTSACVCRHSLAAHRAGGAGGCTFCSCAGYQAAVDPLAGLASEEQADEVTAALHLLAGNPAFRNVSPEHLLDISRRGHKRRFLAGTVIMEQGAPSDRVEFLLKGVVKIEREVHGHEHQLIVELGPGEIVGEMGILHGAPRTATVTALDDLETLELSADEIRDVFRHDHDVVVAFIRMIHQRLHGTES